MGSIKQEGFDLKKGDALLIVDVQKDFLPEGNLAVPDGDKVVPVINEYINVAKSKDIPVYATRDWHPPGHTSFKGQGGLWPSHCVVNTVGAEFAYDLMLPDNAEIISKATEIDRDAYSGFEGTDLDARLRSSQIGRLLIGGLATDYCVLNTVKDSVKHGYKVLLMEDGVRAVNINPDDGKKAISEMIALNVVPINKGMLK